MSALLVLDEPWEGLDAPTRGLVPAIVAEVVAAGGSVLVSDHLGEVGRLATAHRWYVQEAQVIEEAAIHNGRWVVEVAVTGDDPGPAIAELRAAGHDIIGVRRA